MPVLPNPGFCHMIAESVPEHARRIVHIDIHIHNVAIMSSRNIGSAGTFMGYYGKWVKARSLVRFG
jgi:hypothetical protein